MDEKLPETLLEFCYDARLIDDDRFRRFDGCVAMSEWKHKHFSDKRQAAWAFVRGRCDEPGQWLCLVTVVGKSTETRVIEVTHSEGAIFRRDIEVEMNGGEHAGRSGS